MKNIILLMFITVSSLFGAWGNRSVKPDAGDALSEAIEKSTQCITSIPIFLDLLIMGLVIWVFLLIMGQLYNFTIFIKDFITEYKENKRG